jgi:hypothetical protein
MTVIPPSFVIMVAPIGVKRAPMRERGPGKKKNDYYTQ